MNQLFAIFCVSLFNLPVAPAAGKLTFRGHVAWLSSKRLTLRIRLRPAREQAGGCQPCEKRSKESIADCKKSLFCKLGQADSRQLLLLLRTINYMTLNG